MSLYLLPPTDYAALQPLFGAATPLGLYARGVLSGKYPGKGVVDSVHDPQTALVLKEAWCNLIGNPDNPAFIEALRQELVERRLLGEQTNVLFFMDPTEEWAKVLSHLVADRQPIETPRYVFYTATPQRIVQTPPPPPGYELVFIDQALRRRIDDDWPSDVKKVLSLRRDAASPDEMGFGYVALHERSCAAWSVIDFIVGTEGEIRLVTDERHRRRGLAFLTSAAAINYGLAHGLERVVWDVAASNRGSIRIAEKLGLSFLRETRELVLIFPEVGYLINLAWSHLDAGRFGQTLAVTERMLASGQQILVQYGHFLTGAVQAGLDQPILALHHLNRAVDAGFDDVGEVDDNPRLALLHQMPGWAQFRARLQGQPGQ